MTIQLGRAAYSPFKLETFATPRLSLKSAKGSYIALCIDLDPPIVSWPFLGPILHWLQSDLVAQTAQEAHDGLVQLSSLDTPFIANYRGAGPPPISSPHRYVFLLYEQPSNFDIKIHAPNPGKEVGLSSRLRYDLSAFEKKANLGPVVAANYFCSN